MSFWNEPQRGTPNRFVVFLYLNVCKSFQFRASQFCTYQGSWSYTEEFRLIWYNCQWEEWAGWASLAFSKEHYKGILQRRYSNKQYVVCHNIIIPLSYHQQILVKNEFGFLYNNFITKQNMKVVSIDRTLYVDIDTDMYMYSNILWRF